MPKDTTNQRSGIAKKLRTMPVDGGSFLSSSHGQKEKFSQMVLNLCICGNAARVMAELVPNIRNSNVIYFNEPLRKRVCKF